MAFGRNVAWVGKALDDVAVGCGQHQIFSIVFKCSGIGSGNLLITAAAMNLLKGC